MGYVERYAGYQSFEVGMMARNWGEPELYKSSGLKSLRCQYATGVRPPGSLTQPIHKCEIVTGSLGFAIYSSNLIYLI